MFIFMVKSVLLCPNNVFQKQIIKTLFFAWFMRFKWCGTLQQSDMGEFIHLLCVEQSYLTLVPGMTAGNSQNWTTGVSCSCKVPSDYVFYELAL